MNGEEASSQPAHNIRGPHRVGSPLQWRNCRGGKHLSSWDRTTVAPELYRPRRSVTFTQPQEALLTLSHKALSTATNTSTQGWWLERGRGHLGSWGTRGQSWGTRGQQWMNILGTDSFTPQAAIVHERVFYDLGNYVVLLKVLSTFSTKRERGRICTVKSKDQAKVNRII